MSHIMGSCAFCACFLSFLALARGGQFSQRLDTPIAAYGWTPLISVPAGAGRFQQTSLGRVYTVPYQDNPTSQIVYQQARANGGADAPRQFSASSPKSRTVTASITWPPDRPVQGPPQPQPEPQPEPQPQPQPGPQPGVPPPEVVGPGLPEEDIARPETDPPVLDSLLSARPEDDRVVKTTLKTPVSHGYVVALVKKPTHLKSYFKSKVPGAVKDDQPAFFVYVPPNKPAGIGANAQVLRSRPPLLRATSGQQPRQYQPPLTQVIGPTRYNVVPVVHQPVTGTGVPQFLQVPKAQAVPAVLVYVPQGAQFSAPLLVPVNPPAHFNTLADYPKPAPFGSMFSKGFLEATAAPEAPWFTSSLEAPPEDIVKLALTQLEKFHA